MTAKVILASGSEVRKRLLEAAMVPLDVRPAVVDEESARRSLAAEGASPLETATALADLKARRAWRPSDSGLVIGCDQIIEFEGKSYSKSTDMAAAAAFLRMLRGRTHSLHSAAVIWEAGIPVWRGVSSADVTFRQFSDGYLDSYLQRGGPDLLRSAGCYRIEEEGIRLIADLSGDIYAVYGLPMIALLGYLGSRGVLES